MTRKLSSGGRLSSVELLKLWSSACMNRLASSWLPGSRLLQVVSRSPIPGLHPPQPAVGDNGKGLPKEGSVSAPGGSSPPTASYETTTTGSSSSWLPQQQPLQLVQSSKRNIISRAAEFFKQAHADRVKGGW